MTWTLEVPEDISELVTQFTDQLVEEGLVEKIISEFTLYCIPTWMLNN